MTPVNVSRRCLECKALGVGEGLGHVAGCSLAPARNLTELAPLPPPGYSIIILAPGAFPGTWTEFMLTDVETGAGVTVEQDYYQLIGYYSNGAAAAWGPPPAPRPI